MKRTEVTKGTLGPVGHFRYAFPVSVLLAFPLVAFFATVVLHVAALKVFPRIGLVDFPKRYGLTRAPIPYPTGILCVVVFLAFTYLTLPVLTFRMAGVFLAIGLLAAVCFVDDRTPLSPLLRIAAQLAVAAILIFSSVRIDAVTNPLPGGVFGVGTSIVLSGGWPYALSIVFTVLWILFTVNALNWFDGIPGQVSTLSTIAFLTIGFLALSDRVQQPWIAYLAFLLAATSGAALLFDFPPSRVLMGDTGSMFFGLMIGVLTIYAGGKVATAFLVLGVPLIDSLFVVIRRLRRGHAPWKGDVTDQHLHHRLLKKGWSPRQVIALTASIGALFGITALFLDTWEKVAAGVVLFLVMLGLSWYSGK
ncbi:MAG: undecaprenyl/decaprenyl-phosphate alpha-N-acetylglucosaminyl 1-phosphate transferase [Candidatus Peribacteraceae bacterium]|nr:undecaprenyl/decaprenyl-phosphate alpha-N-acetylglucosaminyl 1-phosphate transferase [Candidatus Peribacteraceae bacterium]